MYKPASLRGKADFTKERLPAAADPTRWIARLPLPEPEADSLPCPQLLQSSWFVLGVEASQTRRQPSAPLSSY